MKGMDKLNNLFVNGLLLTRVNGLLLVAELI